MYGVLYKISGALKVCRKFTGKHPCRNMISVKLLWNFIEIVLRLECSPVNLLHIFRTLFPKNASTSGFLYNSIAQLRFCLRVVKLRSKFQKT